jgi:hypothetical protein
MGQQLLYPLGCGIDEVLSGRGRRIFLLQSAETSCLIHPAVYVFGIAAISLVG